MSLYFRISSASLSITFLSPEVNMHVPSSLSRIMMSGLLFGMVLSVCTCQFCKMVTLPQLLLPACTDRGSHQRSLPNFTPVSSHMLQCSSSLSLRVPFCCPYWTGRHTVVYCIVRLSAVCICSQFLFAMFLAPYFIINASPCAAIH